jgi:hypothetical protein
VQRPNQKSQVENGVAYVEKNLLAGLELTDFAAMPAAGRLWVDTVANVRIHGETHERPLDRFVAVEQAQLQHLNHAGYDTARVIAARTRSRSRECSGSPRPWPG